MVGFLPQHGAGAAPAYSVRSTESLSWSPPLPGLAWPGISSLLWEASLPRIHRCTGWFWTFVRKCQNTDGFERGGFELASLPTFNLDRYRLQGRSLLA